METLVGTSTSTATLSPFKPSPPPLQHPWFRPIQGGYSSFPFPRPLSLPNTQNYSPLIPKAAKKSSSNGDKKGSEKKKHKADSHSFAPRPDEATGPFPESILLREEIVQEDGNFMPEFADDDEEELFKYLNLRLESDLLVDQMRHYEVVYLIHEDYAEQVENVNSKIQDFLKEKKGKLWRFSDWGMRRLAYKIKKARHAHYILMNFELEAQSINEFKTMLDQDERVTRHLVIKRDNAITEECPPPPEFHTLRADGADREEDEDDLDDDEEYDDDDEEEEEGEEDEEELEDGDGNELEVQDSYEEEGDVEEEGMLDDEEDDNELEVQDSYEEEGDVEEEGTLDDEEDDAEDDDIIEIKQPVPIKAPRKKGLKFEKAVR